MKKKPHKKREPKPPAPPTYQEVMKAKGWGQGDRAMHPEPGKDRYFVTAGGKVEDKNWEPGPDDWALVRKVFPYSTRGEQNGKRVGHKVTTGTCSAGLRAAEAVCV